LHCGILVEKTKLLLALLFGVLVLLGADFLVQFLRCTLVLRDLSFLRRELEEGKY